MSALKQVRTTLEWIVAVVAALIVLALWTGQFLSESSLLGR